MYTRRLSLMRLSRLLTSGLVLYALSAFIACSGGEASNAPAVGGGRGTQAAVVPVAVGTVVQKSMPIEIRVIGSGEAYSTVAVHAQITGQLTSVTFKEGDDVREGQVLFTLDRRPLDAALQQAQANLDHDVAQSVLAASQAKRYQDLAERGIATREQVDTMRSGATALDATVAADRAAIESARVQLEYATIAAPLSGRTGALMVHNGNLVRALDASPLVVINQVSPIYVSFGIPEARLPDLKRYMAQGSLQVSASPPNETGPAASGRITFVDNAVDATTGTIRIKGTFPNADRRLWPGQFVNVVVALTTDPRAIVAPSAAIQDSQQGPYAVVVKADHTVEMRTVTVDRISGDETVIQKGLKPGETVVTDGHLRLVPGSRVSIKGADDAPKVTP
jgi:multidrug efflux system membrane fusion protein